MLFTKRRKTLCYFQNYVILNQRISIRFFKEPDVLPNRQLAFYLEDQQSQSYEMSWTKGQSLDNGVYVDASYIVQLMGSTLSTVIESTAIFEILWKTL